MNPSSPRPAVIRAGLHVRPRPPRARHSLPALPRDSGPPAPVFDEGQETVVECDTVLIAAGQMPSLGFLAAPLALSAKSTERAYVESYRGRTDIPVPVSVVMRGR